MFFYHLLFTRPESKSPGTNNFLTRKAVLFNYNLLKYFNFLDKKKTLIIKKKKTSKIKLEL